MQFHLTKEADPTLLIFIYCFQGNNAAEPNVILSEFCINADLIISIYSQSVM